MLVCAPSHRFAGRQSVAFDDLSGEALVSFDTDLTIRREIDRALTAHNTEARVVMEFDNIETIKRAVEIGAGVAFLPQPTIAREVAAGTLAAVPLATDELVRPLGILHRRGKELGVTVRRFIDLLRADGKLARQDREERKEKHDPAATAANRHERREVLVAG